MKNALKYGISIGIVSGIWLLIMHFAGVYSVGEAVAGKSTWLEYLSVLIPLIGLYLGIKSYRDRDSAGKMEFFEGIVEGFKIMLIAGVIIAFFAVVYIQFVPNSLTSDYMGRVFGAGVIGLLFNIMLSLILMNKQRNL